MRTLLNLLSLYTWKSLLSQFKKLVLLCIKFLKLRYTLEINMYSFLHHKWLLIFAFCRMMVKAGGERKGKYYDINERVSADHLLNAAGGPSKSKQLFYKSRFRVEVHLHTYQKLQPIHISHPELFTCFTTRLLFRLLVFSYLGLP